MKLYFKALVRVVVGTLKPEEHAVNNHGNTVSLLQKFILEISERFLFSGGGHKG